MGIFFLFMGGVKGGPMAARDVTDKEMRWSGMRDFYSWSVCFGVPSRRQLFGVIVRFFDYSSPRNVGSGI